MKQEIIPDRSGHLDVDGQKVWWEFHGDGSREAVCLLNGLAMHTKAWYSFLPLLIDDYDIERLIDRLEELDAEFGLDA